MMNNLTDSLKKLYAQKTADWYLAAQKYAQYLGCDATQSFHSFSEDSMDYQNKFEWVVDLSTRKEFENVGWRDLEIKYENLPE